MDGRTLIALAGLALVAPAALADASYQDSTQITGGSFVETLKSVPFLPASTKKLFDPIISQVFLHRNQLASVSKASTEIIDLDAETITRLDHERKTYTVTTFQQLRDAFKDAPKKIEEAQAKLKDAQAGQSGTPPDSSHIKASFDVAVTDPDVSKVVNGVQAKEQVLTTKITLTDTTAATGSGPTSLTYNLVQEIWTASEDPPELKEIDAFYRRYAQTLMKGVDAAALMKSLRPVVNQNALASIFAKQPGADVAFQEAIHKAATELAKIKGTRILEVSRFGGDAPGATGTAGAGAPAVPSTGQVAANATSDAATSAASTAADKLGSIGASAAHSLLGAFHHQSAPAPAAAPAASGTATGSAVLYESTTQKSQFSQAEVAASVFAIPAGYQKVDNELLKSLKT